jgi:hypothetical protein
MYQLLSLAVALPSMTGSDTETACAKRLLLTLELERPKDIPTLILFAIPGPSYLWAFGPAISKEAV